MKSLSDTFEVTQRFANAVGAPDLSSDIESLLQPPLRAGLKGIGAYGGVAAGITSCMLILEETGDECTAEHMLPLLKSQRDLLDKIIVKLNALPP